MIAPTQQIVFQIPPFPVRSFTVDEYHRMIQSGILTEEDRVELLEGWIVPKMPHSPLHDATIDKSQEILRDLVPAGWRVRVQMAVTLPASEPEPDIAVVEGTAQQFADRHPSPKEIGLLVEVADSSLPKDRHEKGPTYARALIPVYWIINLVTSNLEVHCEPTGPQEAPRYQNVRILGLGDIVPVVIQGKKMGEIKVKELFPVP